MERKYKTNTKLKRLSILSLVGSVTNYIPVSPLVLLYSPATLITTLKRKKIYPFIAPTLLLLLFYFVYTLIYHPQSLVTYEFFRRDGNVFITLLPIIVIGSIPININLEKLVKRFLIFSTCITSLVAAYYVGTHGSNIVIQDVNTFRALFIAHNAAGGYLAMITALAFGVLYKKTKDEKRLSISYLAMVLINAVFLYLTNSRGSMLGLALAIPAIVIGPKVGTLEVIISSIVILGLLYYFYPTWVSAGMPDAGFTSEALKLSVRKSQTIILRAAYLWPRALYLWFTSPILGVGFGSYNDLPYSLAGIKHFFMQNTSDTIVYASSHAHNTYLHLLAETGIVGLVFLISWLKSIFKTIHKALSSTSLRIGVACMFWTALFSSYTEHRLFTPSQMMPFTIILGLAIANYNFRRKLNENTTKRNNTK